jgi:hypothetical protein
MIMSDTLKQLKDKANRLHTKLRANGVNIDKRFKLDLFAYVIGQENWDDIVSQYTRRPRPHTSYQPCPQALHRRTLIPLELAKSIIDEIKWPSDYVPVFNTLPRREEGYVIVPNIFIQSHVFTCRRKRKKHCLRERIALFSDDHRVSKDHIFYTGETLNMYDESIFYFLLYVHPEDLPVGREFTFNQLDIEKDLDKNISPVSLEASLDRMRDCCLEVPDLNFVGPLINNYQKVKSRFKGKKAYRISLNPQLISLYHDTAYADAMESGNLYHHNPDYSKAKKGVSYRKMHQALENSQKQDFIRYSRELGKPWPTHDSDMAALYAILSKDAVNGQITFKFFEDVRFYDDDERVAVKFPYWMIQAQEHFIDLYGKEAGSMIFNKVVKRFTEPMFR